MVLPSGRDPAADLEEVADVAAAEVEAPLELGAVTPDAEAGYGVSATWTIGVREVGWTYFRSSSRTAM
jgi:hypothetical protein